MDAEAQALLAELTSENGSRVWAATGTVVREAGPETLRALTPYLSSIRRATAGLDLGGQLLDNDIHLRQTLRVIAAAGEGLCPCAVYEGYPGYDPRKEQARGHVEILRTTPPDWNMTYWCRCRHCAGEYEVEQGEYHTTWWTWTRRG